jgi:uncharacterized protein (TIGR00369 family)
MPATSACNSSACPAGPASDTARGCVIENSYRKDKTVVSLFETLSNPAGHATFAIARGTMMNDTDRGDFRERIRQSFSRQAAMHTIGAELTRVEHGVVEIELPFDVKLTQQHGILHAGVISAALDSACGFAAYSVIDAEASILTIEFKVNLMSPGRGERFLFRGEITKPGSNIIVADGRGYAISDGPAKLIASMTGTMMVIRGREGITG